MVKRGSAPARASETNAALAREQPSPRPGILFVTPWLAGGGTETNLATVACGFAGAGYRVGVVAWKVVRRLGGNLNPSLQQMRLSGVAVDELPMQGSLRIARRAFRLAALARRAGYGVIVGCELSANLAAIVAKIITRGRLRAVAQIQIASGLYRQTADSLLLAMARLLYRRADEIVAVSESIRCDAARFFKLDPERITTIHNPLPLARIKAMAGEPLPFLVPERFIVCCGRLDTNKSFADVITALGRLRDRLQASLVILGEGPERDALRRLAERYSISERVLMPGFEPNPHRFFARAGAFVLSSRSEAFALALTEAMACGAPVIAARSQGPDEILGGGKFGLLYSAGDVEGLMASIVSVFESPGETTRRVEAAFARVQDFAQEKVLPALERCYFGRPN